MQIPCSRLAITSTGLTQTVPVGIPVVSPTSTSMPSPQLQTLGSLTSALNRCDSYLMAVLPVITVITIVNCMMQTAQRLLACDSKEISTSCCRVVKLSSYPVMASHYTALDTGIWKPPGRSSFLPQKRQHHGATNPPCPSGQTSIASSGVHALAANSGWEIVCS